MASSNAWSDFQQIRHSIRMNTVDRLKHIIQGINEECHQQIAKSGKKQEIIERIEAFLDNLYARMATDQYTKVKDVIIQVRTKGQYPTKQRGYGYGSAMPPPAPVYNSIAKPTTYSDYGNPGPSTMPSYNNPYGLPRRPPSTIVPPAPPAGVKAGIHFKDSLFYTIKEAVSRVVDCPESTGSSDRRQAGFDFSLNSDQVSRLTAHGSKTQLRLFCTSSVFYASNNPYGTNSTPCPIEFPPTCEVRVNSVQLSANLKGLKKKPGTAPPPDLGKLIKYTGSNRVDMIYLNTQSQQGVPPKKYHMIAMVVEVTTVQEVVDDLKTRYRSSDEIRQQMLQSVTDDDDIVAGPQKMSLKCPLSFVRIETPARSSKCVHSQCFDATSWFSVMEQTTTWLCPVCERVLDCKDLIVDGYFDEILKQTPSSVEDVIVEPEGEWHTADNKYASKEWKASHAPVLEQPAPSRKEIKSEESHDHLLSGLGNEKAKSSEVEVVVLESDDEDEGRVQRELSPSQASPMNRSYASVPSSQTETSLSQQSDVIDLTVDSDEERPSIQAGKRKAPDIDTSSASPTESIWKKGKFDHDHAPPPSVLSPSLSHVSGANHYPTSLPRQTHATPQSASSLPHSLPSYPYSSYQNRPGLPASVPQLPPLSNSFLPGRPSNSNVRWS
ncbi:hypothetical protein AX15_001768 [Amanita polypyramis BW_CC]|nr:hypothetical protein AX15_001768 [Amanita polypyramis BW_CC]